MQKGACAYMYVCVCVCVCVCVYIYIYIVCVCVCVLGAILKSPRYREFYLVNILGRRLFRNVVCCRPCEGISRLLFLIYTVNILSALLLRTVFFFAGPMEGSHACGRKGEKRQRERTLNTRQFRFPHIFCGA